MTIPEALPYVGFSKLRPGRIHIYCPGCGRKQSNAPREKDDPLDAVLVHIYCERCSDGCKDAPVKFLDAPGRRIVEAWERI